MSNQTWKLYKRAIDCGNGNQFVETKSDSTITKQWLAARHGANHSYSGNGNPEIVGKNISDFRGWGFRQVRMSENQYSDYIEHDYDPGM